MHAALLLSEAQALELSAALACACDEEAGTIFRTGKKMHKIATSVSSVAKELKELFK